MKAGLLEAKGRATEAQALDGHAAEIGSETEVNMLGYQELAAGRGERALELFARNLK